MQAEFVLAAQTIVSRRLNPMETGVVSIAQVKSGTTHNIIPNEAYIEGTVRTYSNDIRNMFEEELKLKANNIALANNGTCDFKYIREYDSTINTLDEALYLAESAEKVLGKENVILLEHPSMGAEDFSRYINHKKGAIAWLGIAYKDRYNYPIHHPKFEVNEEALINGSKIFIDIVKRIGGKYTSK
jgi:amidohydrolase